MTETSLKMKHSALVNLRFLQRVADLDALLDDPEVVLSDGQRATINTLSREALSHLDEVGRENAAALEASLMREGFDCSAIEDR